MTEVEQRDYEEAEQQDYQEREPQEFQEVILGFIEVLWRRKAWAFTPFLIGILVSGFLVYSLPSIYRSRTLILVEAQQVPQDFVKSAVSGSIEGRLSTIKQQILSRTNLKKLIDKYNLYQNNDSTFSLRFNKIVSSLNNEETVDLMRKDIEIETIGDKKKSVDAFAISFDEKSPEIAMNVTNELASLFIEENLKIREQLVEGTTIFLENELQNLKNILENQEQQIANFKRQFIGELPEQLDANLRALDRYQSDLLASRYTKRALIDRIAFFENSLEGFSQTNGDSSQADFLGHAKGRTSIINRKLLEAETTLAEIRLQYTEDYPDIQILRLEIQSLKDHFKIQLKKEESKDQTFGLSVSEGTSQTGLKGQIRQERIELMRLEEQEKQLKNQIQIFEQRVENVPSREQELAILVRDYNNTQNSYQVLLDKKLNAKISENLEKRQKGERFRIIDRAHLPEKPISPNRFKIGFLGLLLGLGAGVSLAFLRDKFNRVIQRPEEVEQMASFPLLENIPDFTEDMMKDKQ